MTYPQRIYYWLGVFSALVFAIGLSVRVLLVPAFSPRLGAPLPLAHEEAALLFEQCSRKAPRSDRAPRPVEVEDAKAIQRGLRVFLARQGVPRWHWSAGAYRGQYARFFRDGVSLVYASFAVEMSGRHTLSDGQAIRICDGKFASWGVVYDPTARIFSELLRNGP